MQPHETVKYAVNVNQFTHLDDFEGMLDFVATAEKTGTRTSRWVPLESALTAATWVTMR